MKLVLGVGGALTAAIFLFFGSMIATDPADDIRLSAPGAKVGESGSRFVTGALENHTGNRYARLEFEIDLLDESGTWVGGQVVEGETLGPNQTWTFEVPIGEERAAQARLRDLRCTRKGEKPRPRTCFFPPTLIQLPSTS
jgi:hypothetical protein